MKCDKCETVLVQSSGWTPTYNDPDNSSGATEAEPFCPKCDLGPYQSGGRNPNWEKCCYTCALQIRSKQHSGWGWCSIRNNASVSPHGGCSEHVS